MWYFCKTGKQTSRVLPETPSTTVNYRRILLASWDTSREFSHGDASYLGKGAGIAQSIRAGWPMGRSSSPGEGSNFSYPHSPNRFYGPPTSN
jgi:hypothetical protein